MTAAPHVRPFGPKPLSGEPRVYSELHRELVAERKDPFRVAPQIARFANRSHDGTGSERPKMQTSTERADELLSRVLDRAALADMPAPKWDTDKWMIAGGLSLIYGKPGVGKTTVAIDSTCSTSTGTWWHHWRTEQGPVFYVAAEGAAMFDARIGAWEQHHDTAVTDIYVLPQAVNMLSSTATDALADVVCRLGAKRVVLDTLNRCMPGGDENSAKDMGQFIAGCDHVRQKSGASVLVLHHDSRAGGNPRGSSALDGACDTVISVTAENGVVTLKQTKQKDAPELPPFTLKRISVGESVVLEDYSDHDTLDGPRLTALTALCEIATSQGVAPGVWMRQSTLAQRTFYRAQKWLLEHDMCHDVSGTRTPRYAATEAGRQASANLVPLTAMAHGHSCATTPPPLGGGT